MSRYAAASTQLLRYTLLLIAHAPVELTLLLENVGECLALRRRLELVVLLRRLDYTRADIVRLFVAQVEVSEACIVLALEERCGHLLAHVL